MKRNEKRDQQIFVSLVDELFHLRETGLSKLDEEELNKMIDNRIKLLHGTWTLQLNGERDALIQQIEELVRNHHHDSRYSRKSQHKAV